MRCLIVDDNVSFRRAMRHLLERDGAEVVDTASNGAEALECAGRLRPAIVLMDVRLGSESGFDIAQRLRERFTGDWQPAIILMSTHAEDELAARMEASPYLRFLEKTSMSVGRIEELLSARA